MKSQEQSIILRMFFSSQHFAEKPLIGTGRSFPVDRWASQTIVPKDEHHFAKNCEKSPKISEKKCLFKKGRGIKVINLWFHHFGDTKKTLSAIHMSIIALFLPGQGPAYASVFVQDEDAQARDGGFFVAS